VQKLINVPSLPGIILLAVAILQAQRLGGRNLLSVISKLAFKELIVLLSGGGQSTSVLIAVFALQIVFYNSFMSRPKRLTETYG